MSTATKDSGIHSNCDLDSHDDELSALHYKRRNKHCGHDSDSSDPRRGRPVAFELCYMLGIFVGFLGGKLLTSVGRFNRFQVNSWSTNSAVMVSMCKFNRICINI